MPVYPILPPVPVTGLSPGNAPNGLYDILVTNGSSLSEYDGQEISVNTLATKYSSLHYDYKVQTEGWSTKGYQAPNFNKTIQDYLSYRDGFQNFLPLPSTLELTDGVNVDPKYRPLYNAENGGYLAVAKKLQQF
jgi:hypothetical protein